MSSAAKVPFVAPRIALDKVQTGKPPSASTWQTIASLANYCNGRGSTLVPAYYSGTTVADGDSALYRYKVYSNHQARQRFWVVRARSASATDAMTVTVTAGASSAEGIVDPTSDNHAITVLETGTGAVLLPIEISVTIAAAGADALIESIACYEVPRGALNTTLFGGGEQGVSLDTMTVQEPIWHYTPEHYPDPPGDPDPAVNVTTMSAVLAMRYNQDTTAATLMPCVRNLWCWAVPTVDALTTASTSDVTITRLPITYLAKRGPIKGSSSGASLRVHVYGKVNAGSASVTVGSATVTLTSTSYAWVDEAYTASGIEDLDQPDGRYDSGGGPEWSEITATCKNLTSASLNIAGICVYQEAP